MPVKKDDHGSFASFVLLARGNRVIAIGVDAYHGPSRRGSRSLHILLRIYLLSVLLQYFAVL